MMTRGGFLAGAGEAAAPVVELARNTTAFKSASDLTTYTSDARSIGSASATREVYALFSGFTGSSGRTISSVTIGGVSAVQRAFVRNGGLGNSTIAAIYSANVPTGSTAVVVVTFSGAMADFACACIALDGLNSTTPEDTATGTANLGTDTVSANIDLAGSGYTMAIACDGQAAGTLPTVTWTGLTETVDDPVDDTADTAFSVAYSAPSSSSLNVAVSAQIATSTNSDKALAAITVR